MGAEEIVTISLLRETSMIMSLTVLRSKCKLTWAYLLSFFPLPRWAHHEMPDSTVARQAFVPSLWHLFCLIHPSEQSCAHYFWEFPTPAQLKPSCDLLLKSKQEFLQTKHVRDWHPFRICKLYGLAEGDQEYRREQVKESSFKDLAFK